MSAASPPPCASRSSLKIPPPPQPGCHPPVQVPAIESTGRAPAGRLTTTPPSPVRLPQVSPAQELGGHRSHRRAAPLFPSGLLSIRAQVHGLHRPPGIQPAASGQHLETPAGGVEMAFRLVIAPRPVRRSTTVLNAPRDMRKTAQSQRQRHHFTPSSPALRPDGCPSTP